MINREYYGCDELQEGEFADLAAEPLPGGIALTEEMLREVIARIYRAKGYTPGDIDPQLYEAILETFRNAVNEGLTEAKAAGTPMPGAEFINQLMTNAEVFSAFRTHRMERDMAARMVDDEGRLKPFSRFAKDVEPITRHHVRAWLRTEYDTAVLRAHQAADWKRFERNADVLPNLRWIKSTSVEPGADHKIFWGTVRPINDDFWSAHRPGDRWNCKCSLTATDDEPTAVPVVPRNDRNNMPGRGLENNPGKDGKIFSDRHPYFAESCATCPFKGSAKKGGLMALAARKKGDCYECRSVRGVIDRLRNAAIKRERPPHADEYKRMSKNVYASEYHGANELEDNVRVAKQIAAKIKDDVWLLPRLDSITKEQEELRKKLLPNRVIPGKNPDFMIQGKIFEGKSMMGMKRTDRTYVKNAIENHIKKAKKQADNIILEISSAVDRKMIYAVVKNYLNRSDADREIWVLWKNKLLKYKKSTRDKL